MPALLAVLMLNLPLSYLYLNPAQILDFSDMLIGNILFASNIVMWRQAGYFTPATEYSPLVHTWSLAVEEQFYLFFHFSYSLFGKLEKISDYYY